MTRAQKAPVGAPTPTEAKGWKRCVPVSATQSITKRAPIQGFLLSGEENALSAADLMRITGARSDRQIRRLVETARNGGVPILSSDSGYFLPADDSVVATKEAKQFERRMLSMSAGTRRAARVARDYRRRILQTQIAGQIEVDYDA